MIAAKLLLFSLLLSLTAQSLPLTGSCTKLSSKEVNELFSGHNPFKNLRFKISNSCYRVQLHNDSPREICIASKTITPAPVNPTTACHKLKQGRSLVPWVIGAGWTTILILGLGLATIPSIVVGSTLVLAGAIGMSSAPLPGATHKTFHHLVLDQTYNYTLPPFSNTNLIIIFPSKTKGFSFSYHTPPSSGSGLMEFKLCDKG